MKKNIFKIVAVTLLMAFCIKGSVAAPERDSDRQANYFDNILVNPGFENGKANWTDVPSDGRTSKETLLNQTTVGNGSASLTWAAKKPLDVLQQVVTIPRSLRGTRGYARASTNTAGVSYWLRILSGSNLAASTFIPAGSSTFQYAGIDFMFGAANSTATFQIQSSAANPGAITLDNLYLGGSTASGQDSIANDFKRWKVSAKIGSTNITLSTTDTATREAGDATGGTSLTLTNLNSAVSVGIACFGAASVVGNTTCTGNEDLGITFIAPATADYKVCADFHSRITTASGSFNGMKNTFSLNQVSNANAGTPVVTAYHDTIHTAYGDNVDSWTRVSQIPHHNCVIASLTAGTQYTYVIYAATAKDTTAVSGNVIAVDSQNIAGVFTVEPY